MYNTLLLNAIDMGSMIVEHADILLSSSFSTGEMLILSGGSLTGIMAAITPASVVTDGIMSDIRRWHGGIDDQFSAIDNLVNLIESHQPTWTIPAPLLLQLTDNRSQLQTLINRCRSNQGSRADREVRNSLLKSTVGLCLLQIRIWAYGQFTAGVLTVDDVHALGFLLPTERGGHHSRSEATDIVAEVKATVINEDFIRVVVDQSAGENAAQVVHGWPSGVKTALIVITAADGKTEVYRAMTTHLYTDIRMPAGSRGKQFIIKAAFLKHVDDEPRFGNQPTFSMPMTTEDLVAAIDRQHHEEFEAQLREIENHRQEIERLSASQTKS